MRKMNSPEPEAKTCAPKKLSKKRTLRAALSLSGDQFTQNQTDTRNINIKKKARFVPKSGLKIEAGIVLLSHSLTTAIPSPLAGLTSEFGMGSGVAPPLKTPAKLHQNPEAILIAQLFDGAA